MKLREIQEIEALKCEEPLQSRIFLHTLITSFFQNVWMSAMREDEAVKGYLLDPETHLKFLTLYKDKQFTYDFWYLRFWKIEQILDPKIHYLFNTNYFNLWKSVFCQNTVPKKCQVKMNSSTNQKAVLYHTMPFFCLNVNLVHDLVKIVMRAFSPFFVLVFCSGLKWGYLLGRLWGSFVLCGGFLVGLQWGT